MKTKSNTIISVAAATLALLAACGERDYTKDSPFDNVVYIDAARVKELNQFTFNNVTETGSRTLAATLAFPAEQDVNVSIGADPSLVSLYSSRLGGGYSSLDPKHYTLSASSVVIPAGHAASKPVTVDFHALTDLEIDKGYLLPVTIGGVSGGMGVLEGSRTVCYVVRRSSAITSAVSLRNNYFEVPGFDAGSPTADVVNGRKQLTY